MIQSSRQQKSRLRQELRRQRRSLSATEQRTTALRLQRKLLCYSALQRSRDIALYIPQDGEADPRLLAGAAIRAGKRLWLPCIERDREMVFRRYRPGDRMTRNRYGIPQPSSQAPARAALALDLVLLPLVGFDRLGNRLGMGGGYYDRCFHRCQRRQQQPLLVGVAHSFQQVPQLPRDHWDIPLAAVATEQEIIDTRYGAGH